MTPPPQDPLRAAVDDLHRWDVSRGWPALNVILARIDAALPAATEPADGLRLDEAYTLLVSVIPAVYRSWNQSPNETAERLNALLYAKVTEWVTAYQRDTGRPVDSYPLAALRAEPVPGDGG